MSSTRYVGRRRRPTRLSRLSELPAEFGAQGATTVVKSAAGIGIVLGSGAFVAAPGQAQPPAAAATAQVSAADLLADRGGDGDVSRAATRTAAAVTAPEGAKGGAHDTAGALAVDVVAKPDYVPPKPEPKPKPVKQVEEPVEEPVEETDAPEPVEEPETERAPEQASRSTQRPEPTPQPTGPETGNYAAQAAALGLGPNAQKVYSAVRTQFPDMTNIGGYRAGDPGDHGTGRAVDVMVTGARGDQVNAWLQQHAGELNISYIIWQQRIWFPNGESRMMEDRGSATANHYDHVHVSVN